MNLHNLLPFSAMLLVALMANCKRK